MLQKFVDSVEVATEFFFFWNEVVNCLLYTSDAADDSLRVDLGGRRFI